MQTSDGIHEVFEGDVQYPYADVGAPEMLHISKVNHENRRSHTYTCPYCKRELRPRLGSRAHCFAHKPGERCDMDKYIHATAERLLKEKWDRDEPFEITMTQRTECSDVETCIFHNEDEYACVEKETKTFNLKKHYSRCLVEKKYGEFVPDLCLIDDTGKHEPIFIEIWSKHKNSEKKATSDHMIIEIRLKTAQDLEELPKHSITESETVTFSHFKTIRRPPSKDDGPRLMRYTLYGGTLKSFVDDKAINCSNYKKNHYATSIFEVVCNWEDFPSIQQFWNYCNALAIESGNAIRHCYLCQLYGDDRRQPEYIDDSTFNPDRPVGCRRELDIRGLIECKPNEARTCSYYVLKEKQLERIKKRYSNINRFIWRRSADGSTTEEIQRQKDPWYFDYKPHDALDFESK